MQAWYTCAQATLSSAFPRKGSRGRQLNKERAAALGALAEGEAEGEEGSSDRCACLRVPCGLCCVGMMVLRGCCLAPLVLV